MPNLTRRGPHIEPLAGPQELAARHTIAAALIEGRWTITSWTAAEQAAVDLVDALRAEGIELVAVQWP